MIPLYEKIRNTAAVSDTKISFIATIERTFDKEILAVLAAWLTSEARYETDALKRIYKDLMHEDAEGFIGNKEYLALNEHNGSLFRFYGYPHFVALCDKLYNHSIGAQKTLEETLHETFYARKNHCRYAHKAFAIMLGGGTLFETARSSTTFYRYNLLFYYLTQRLHVWNDSKEITSLLPCTDKTFKRAYREGITPRVLRTNLESAITLTDTAREHLGDDNFFTMFDFLNTDMTQ